MSDPQFSIIVPVYNVEQYVRKCIESILSQSFTDFELLLIDDGSTDGSGRICDEYANRDSRIKVKHKVNEGVSAARNTGIEMASGELVTFIDSDDWIEDDYLQTIFDETEDADILFFGSIWHYEDGCSRTMCFTNSVYENDIERGILLLLDNDIKTNYFGFTWNKVFRKNIIDKYNVRFVETLSVSEDEVYTLDYCKHINNLKIIEKPLYHYLWKENGLTHTKKRKCDYLLLIKSLGSVVDSVSDKDLRLLYLNRIVGLYNSAAWANGNLLQICVDEWKMLKFCKKNKVKLPIRAMLKEFIYKVKSHDK